MVVEARGTKPRGFAAGPAVLTLPEEMKVMPGCGPPAALAAAAPVVATGRGDAVAGEAAKPTAAKLATAAAESIFAVLDLFIRSPFLVDLLVSRCGQQRG